MKPLQFEPVSLKRRFKNAALVMSLVVYSTMLTYTFHAQIIAAVCGFTIEQVERVGMQFGMKPRVQVVEKLPDNMPERKYVLGANEIMTEYEINKLISRATGE